MYRNSYTYIFLQICSKSHIWYLEKKFNCTFYQFGKYIPVQSEHQLASLPLLDKATNDIPYFNFLKLLQIVLCPPSNN